MINQKQMNARKYLERFDEILEQMAYKMLNANSTNSITLNFITCMIPHHQAAIYMCENLLQYQVYPPLKKIADGIILMQTKGINQMREIAKTTYGFINYPKEIKEYQEKYLSITNNMIEKMKNSPRYIYINLDFVEEMIPHHEGAIAMCNNLLQYRIDPRLRKVANTIIEEQSRGVNQLEEIKRMLH